ncbi:MAG: hypothetical protein IPJ65_27370 [Archangiaceae bacterium]|nr:hypothetical protein [Archangiaceae bacterium]
MVSTLAALAVLAQTRYQFELDGAPVGAVELSRKAGRYTYRSTHVYRRSRAERVDTFDLGDPKQPVPEGYWLWRKPKAGCVEGVAELTRVREPLCAEAVEKYEVRGTVRGAPFTARYDLEGELLELVVGKSRFVRNGTAGEKPPPYAKGFAIAGRGKQLALEPEVQGARWPADEPSGTRSAPVAYADSCLELATAYVAANPGARLALGVVVEKGRAYPHAWAVTASGADVDPSAKAAAFARANTAYLELPPAEAGRLYLELLEGRRKLVWRSEVGPGSP